MDQPSYSTCPLDRHDKLWLTRRPDVGVDGPVDGSYFTDVDLLGDICQPGLLKGRSGKEGDRRGSDVAQQWVDPIVDCAHTHIIVRSASRRRSPSETRPTPVDGQRLTGLCNRIRHRFGYIDPSESFASQEQSEDGGRSQEIVEHGEMKKNARSSKSMYLRSCYFKKMSK